MAYFRFLLTIAALAAPSLLRAQQVDNQERELKCQDNRQSGRLVSHCEIKEFTLPATGRLNADGGANGGVSVKGWNRTDVLVRARVQTAAETEAEARALVNQIRIDTANSQVRADGPSSTRNQNWSVSYEIFVPHQTDLSLKTHNGGIRMADVRGRIDFEALNGGVSLKRLAGAVRGHTTNGGLSIELAGDRWDGEALDAETTNGGVSMTVPELYSARLETATVNGHIRVDFPVNVSGEIGRHLSLTLGAGGPLVRAVTTNGGVSLKRPVARSS